jgi:hypothetical protein
LFEDSIADILCESRVALKSKGVKTTAPTFAPPRVRFSKFSQLVICPMMTWNRSGALKRSSVTSTRHASLTFVGLENASGCSTCVDAKTYCIENCGAFFTLAGAWAGWRNRAAYENYFSLFFLFFLSRRM